MTIQELHAKIQATKTFLHREATRQKIKSEQDGLSFREIGDRLDMIHEVERIGVRNLGERENRKITRMIRELEQHYKISQN
ncbi:MAG: hypothetical protein OHK0039_25550 [Bacteroidia bacterium]